VVDAVLLSAAGVLWVLLPAYLANAAATFPRGWGPPMDLGRTWPGDGRRILGSSKTWSGFLVGSLFPLWVGLLQQYLYLIAPPEWRLVPGYGPTLWSAIPVTLLLSVGALTGDAIGSFVKRRIGIPPGGRFFVWDQVLFVLVPVGLGLVLFPATFLPAFWSVPAALWTLFFTLVLHIVFNYVGFWLGLKKVPW
jgi:CDP-2,3-bis-(O-geranylgeranyl)-sn-glycerol synthase